MTPAASAVRRLGFEEVRQILPQRFPLILVDRVLELEPGVRIVALKNVTGNELQFLGHFPQMAVMPGVLIIEAAAQAVILMHAGEQPGGPVPDPRPRFLANANISFRVPVTPGDQMVIEAAGVRRVGHLAIARVKIFVGETVVAAGELTVSSPAEERGRC